MTHPVGFRPEAREEVSAAAQWYEAQRPGLGAGLLAAVDATLARIGEWPAAAPLVGVVSGDAPVRSALVRRYPYRIVYVLQDEAVRVLAVAHNRREPRYWQDRVGQPESVEQAPDAT